MLISSRKRMEETAVTMVGGIEEGILQKQSPLRKSRVSKTEPPEFELDSFIEPILAENPNRHVLFPIHHDDIFTMAKHAISVFWTAEEVDLSKDIRDWEALDANSQHFIKHVLGFFAASDGVLMENLALNFQNEIQLPEAKYFYANQNFMEAIHSEMYSLLIDTYIKDPSEKKDLLEGAIKLSSIKKKKEWAEQWLDAKRNSFATRLVAFACVEGIFFSGSFCSIFWLKKRGLMPGLTTSNEFISRDEGLHTDFACLLYSKLTKKLKKSAVHKIVKDAVKAEKQFIIKALPCELIGMNATLMSQYIEFVADRLCVQLGYPKIFDSANPFEFMERISLEGKDNFFEKRNANYSKSGVGKTAEEMVFSTNEAF
jgi:ribonucleoside-diphosphate reductase beta chain